MPKKIFEPVGHHYIVESSGCDPKVISSVEKVQQILVKASPGRESGQFLSASCRLTA